MDANAAKVGDIIQAPVFVVVPGDFVGQAQLILRASTDRVDVQGLILQQQGQHRLELSGDRLIGSDVVIVLCQQACHYASHLFPLCCTYTSKAL